MSVGSPSMSKHDDFAARCQVHAGANCLFPPVAVKPIIGQSSDDPIRGHQPRPDGWLDRLAASAWRRPIQIESERSLGPYLLARVEDDTDLVRPEVRFPVEVEVEGEVSSGGRGPLPGLFAPARQCLGLLALAHTLDSLHDVDLDVVD